ncbi:hypothetical protein AAHA92_17280 [Salvia divinorum]|uniref:Uncharacterized protein n=1 Tax=Salvia divinorum TaxID=28513 RepID=A0ABD1GYB0_SALDI
MNMLNRQLSQIATSLNEMRGNEGKIPATVKLPGRENVSMITLRSREVYEEPTMKAEDGGPSGSEETDKLINGTGQARDIYGLRRDLMRLMPKIADPFFLDEEVDVATDEKGSKEKKEEEVLLPQSSSDEKNQPSVKIMVDENISAITQEELPSKHADPGMFILPITMGSEKVNHAIGDLGSSVNILPISVYQKMNEARLVHTEVEIQLADGSCIQPEGILVNVLVKVHDFIYPADFHVIRMTEPESAGSSRVLLGRPFLKTARALIDVFNGTISLYYHGEKL